MGQFHIDCVQACLSFLKSCACSNNIKSSTTSVLADHKRHKLPPIKPVAASTLYFGPLIWRWLACSAQSRQQRCLPSEHCMRDWPAWPSLCVTSIVWVLVCLMVGTRESSAPGVDAPARSPVAAGSSSRESRSMADLRYACQSSNNWLDSFSRSIPHGLTGMAQSLYPTCSHRLLTLFIRTRLDMGCDREGCLKDAS